MARIALGRQPTGLESLPFSQQGAVARLLVEGPPSFAGGQSISMRRAQDPYRLGAGADPAIRQRETPLLPGVQRGTAATVRGYGPEAEGARQRQEREIYLAAALSALGPAVSNVKLSEQIKQAETPGAERDYYRTLAGRKKPKGGGLLGRLRLSNLF